MSLLASMVYPVYWTIPSESKPNGIEIVIDCALVYLDFFYYGSGQAHYQQACRPEARFTLLNSLPLTGVQRGTLYGRQNMLTGMGRAFPRVAS